MKIAFLFLTTVSNVVYHQDLWKSFFQNNYNQCSIIIHSKVTCEKIPFETYTVIPKLKTTWANTMDAQIALLRYALEDKDNYKFIFVSESTIPLQAFTDIYDFITSDDNSYFNYQKNYHYERNFKPIPFEQQYKNAQWVILNRKHAQLMVEDTYYSTIINKYPHDQEHYPSTFLGQKSLLSEVKKIDTTLTIWQQGAAHPHCFNDLKTDKYTQKLIKNITEKKFLFARKFSKNCDLTVLLPFLNFKQ